MYRDVDDGAANFVGAEGASALARALPHSQLTQLALGSKSVPSLICMRRHNAQKLTDLLHDQTMSLATRAALRLSPCCLGRSSRGSISVVRSSQCEPLDAYERVCACACVRAAHERPRAWTTCARQCSQRQGRSRTCECAAATDTADASGSRLYVLSALREARCERCLTY